MVNFGTSIVPIIVAFIGVTIGPFLTVAISNVTSHNPIVHYEIEPDYHGDGTKALITLTNYGSAPATNLSLTITATPSKIIKIINDNSDASIFFEKLPNGNNYLGTP